MQALPQHLAGTLGQRQRPGGAKQVKTERDQHQVGEQIEGQPHRRHTIKAEAGRAKAYVWITTAVLFIVAQFISIACFLPILEMAQVAGAK